MAKKKGGASIVADGDFSPVGEAKTDSKKRLVLRGKVARHYYMYQNDAGQILLEPMTLVPAREAWLYKNPKALASVRAGIKAYGDIVHSFISLKDYRGPFLPGFQASPLTGRETERQADRGAGLVALDHYVANVRLGEMAKWEAWYERVLGLKRFMTFDDKDISTNSRR